MVEKNSVDIDFIANDHPWLISFGGLAGNFGMTPFEFVNTTRDIYVNKMYLRDFEQSWYQRGLQGFSEDFDGMILFLRQTLKNRGDKKLVLIGNSMGGYAAIACGVLLNASVVHAFVPQTFVDRLNRLRYLDMRWHKQIRDMHKSTHCKYLDLRKLLASVCYECEINIHYSPVNWLDRIHAERLENFSQVNLHHVNVGSNPISADGHYVAKRLRDEGRLKQIILDSFE